MRRRSASTDYDVVCGMEGVDLDFRSALGRYFLCECKDWGNPADFSAFAKFCRVLDSAKCRFGILFSREEITGTARSTDAAREQLKLFQDRGMVVVVIDVEDLKQIADGANLITMLRAKYEEVRLDPPVDSHVSTKPHCQFNSRLSLSISSSRCCSRHPELCGAPFWRLIPTKGDAYCPRVSPKETKTPKKSCAD